MRLFVCILFLLISVNVISAEKVVVKLTHVKDQSTSVLIVYHFENVGAEKIEGYVFQPAGKGTWPGIVLNHGAANDPLKKAFQIAPTLAKRGYVIISPRYTFALPKNDTYERRDPEVDAKRCLAAGRFAAQIHFVDKKNIGVAGISAGGFTIVDCLGVKHPFKAAVVTSAGIAPYEKEAIERLKTSKTPVFVQHGAEDESIPLEYGQRLYQTLMQAKLKNVKLKIYPGAPHDLYEWNRKKIANDMADWFDKTLKE